MFKKAIFMFAVVVTGFCVTQSANAQYRYGHGGYGGFGHRGGHIDLVPHTTTHIDMVRHGNHFDAVPHTTTHLDRVWHNPNPYRSYRPNYRPTRLVPHTTTHLDYYRHGNHYDAVPHTTTHFDRVPRYSRFGH